MQARGRAAQALWQAYVQRRGHSMGLTLPSSKSLWDVADRSRLEMHGAEAVRDIWMEVRPCSLAAAAAACCSLLTGHCAACLTASVSAARAPACILHTRCNGTPSANGATYCCRRASLLPSLVYCACLPFFWTVPRRPHEEPDSHGTACSAVHQVYGQCVQEVSVALSRSGWALTATGRARWRPVVAACGCVSSGWLSAPTCRNELQPSACLPASPLAPPPVRAARCLCCRCSRAPTPSRTSWCSARRRWCCSRRWRSTSCESALWSGV